MSREVLMNSKSEWNSARIPRIVIEEGERQTEDSESGLGRRGEEDKRNRRLVRVTDDKEKSTKRGAEEEWQDQIENRQEKRRRVESVNVTERITMKRQSAETERHIADVKRKKDRERRSRQSVGIIGDKESAGRDFWKKKFSVMAEKMRGVRIDVKGEVERVTRMEIPESKNEMDGPRGEVPTLAGVVLSDLRKVGTQGGPKSLNGKNLAVSPGIMRMKKMFENVEESGAYHEKVNTENKVRQVVNGFETLMTRNRNHNLGTITKKKIVKRLDKKVIKPVNTLDNWVKAKAVNETGGPKFEKLGEESERRGATNVIVEGAKYCEKEVQDVKVLRNSRKLDRDKTRPSVAKGHSEKKEMSTIINKESKLVQKEMNLATKVKIWDAFFEEKKDGGAQVRNTGQKTKPNQNTRNFKGVTGSGK